MASPIGTLVLTNNNVLAIALKFYIFKLNCKTRNISGDLRIFYFPFVF